MSNFLTITNSDDSDDLPSFEDRVKKLLAPKKDKEKRIKSPKRKVVSQIHAISDSESSDSVKTIPFSADDRLSPVPSLSEFPTSSVWNGNEETSKRNLYNTIHDSPFLDLIEKNDNSDSPTWSLPDVPDDVYLDVRFENLSSDEEICTTKKSKNIAKTEKRANKDIEKEQRKKIRLEKIKEKEFMKALKASERELLKHQKPEECIKNLKIVLDHNLLSLSEVQSVFNLLDQNNLSYSIEENICKNSINWYRKIINISTESHEILREEREKLAETLIMIIPNEDFLKMVYAYVQNSKGKHHENKTLEDFVINVKSLHPGCDITCVTIGFQKYMRNIKDEGTFDVKTIAKQVHKNASEEAVIALQLQSSVNFNFLDSMHDLGCLIHHFTKAIAEAPKRKEKENLKSLAFSWYAESDSHCPIKLSKDGSSFIKLWRQQIQQFQNVGPEVADAIVSHYSSLQSLLKAYKKCATTKDAENLLSDIVVRRNYGPLGTQKRIGPELSFKIYLFFTSKDGNKLLKR